MPRAYACLSRRMKRQVLISGRGIEETVKNPLRRESSKRLTSQGSDTARAWTAGSYLLALLGGHTLGAARAGERPDVRVVDVPPDAPAP